MKHIPQTSARKARIFISYARADDELFVERLYHDLKDEFGVWWDRMSMPNRGLTFLQEIRDAIDRSDRLLLVAGPGAFTSDYVRDEWQYAYENYKGINIALRLGDYDDLPEQLRGFDAPDFCDDANYSERLKTLRRQLTEPVAPIGAFHNVPALPPHFLGRPDDLDALRNLVIADVDKPTLISAEKRTTAVEGMSGIGKSALATAFAHDRKVRFAFPDGIVWVIVGREPTMYELYRAVGVALGDNLSNYPDETIACQNTQKMLAEKKCLLVLDDVWELPVARAFRDLISGTPARLLITTRNLQINNVLGANEYRLRLIDKLQAVEYLHSWVGDDPDLETVAEKLGYLFLALKLAGARMKKDGLSGEEYLKLFDRVSRMKIDQRATDRDDSLEASITLSVDAAFESVEEKKVLYHTLGIFREDTVIPQQTILQLWKHIYPNVDEFDLLEILNALVDLALVEREKDKTITLHDLLHSYTQEKLGDRTTQTHRDLLDTYGVDHWHKLPPDEPYLWQSAAYHLTRSERVEDLYHLLTDTPDWMEAKLAALGNHTSFVSDLDLCLSNYVHNTPDDIGRVATLWAVRQIINVHISAYTNKLLSTLVWIDKNIENNGFRSQQALNIARLRSYAISKFDGLATIFQCLREAGDFRPDILHEAYTVALHEIDEKPSMVSALSYIAAEMYHDDRPFAEQLFQHVHDVISSISHESDKAFAMHILAGRLSHKGDYERALQLADNCPDDFWKAHTLIDIAETLFEHNLGHAVNLVENALDIIPDIENTKLRHELFHRLGVAIARSGDKKQTRRFVSVLAGDDQKASILCELASAKADGENQATDEDFNEIQVLVSNINDAEKREACLIKFVQALEINGRHDWSLQAVSDITSTVKRSEALFNVVKGLSQAGEYERAYDIARNIERIEQKAKALNSLAWELNDVDEARASDMFRQAYEAALLIQNDKDKVGILSDLALSLSLREHPQALEVLQKAHEANQYIVPADPGPLALRGLALSLSRVGEYEKAEQVGRLTVSESVKDEILGNLVSVLAADAKYDYAFSVIDEIRSDRIRSFSLRSISAALARSGNYEQAHTVAMDIPVVFWKASALRAIGVEMFASTSDRANSILAEAELTIAKIDDEEERAKSLLYLGMDLNKLEDPRAVSILEDARKIALEIEHDLFKSVVLSNLAFAFAQLGDYEQAKYTALLIDDTRKTGNSERALAGVQARSDKIDEAYQTALSIDDTITRALALVDIVAIVANSDKYDLAFDIASNIEELGQRAEAFSILATALAYSGDFSGTSGAFATLSICSPDTFLEIVSSWAKSFEDIEQGLFQRIIQETVRVISWAHPSWKSIYKIIAS